MYVFIAVYALRGQHKTSEPFKQATFIEINSARPAQWNNESMAHFSVFVWDGVRVWWQKHWNDRNSSSKQGGLKCYVNWMFLQKETVTDWQNHTPGYFVYYSAILEPAGTQRFTSATPFDHLLNIKWVKYHNTSISVKYNLYKPLNLGETTDLETLPIKPPIYSAA